jgi:hypothetical protein
MNIDELSRLSEDELRSRANGVLRSFEDEGPVSREQHIAEAQFYLAEIERRRQAHERVESARIARRDFRMELCVIVLIGAELVLAIIAIYLGGKEGDKQLDVLDKLNKNGALTTVALNAVHQAQEDSLATQKTTLDNIVGMNTALQDQMGLNYVVSLDLTYDDSQPLPRVVLFNKGKTNLYLWGTKLDEQKPSMEKEPFIVTPLGSYYIYAKTFKDELLHQVPKGSKARVPFDLYLKTTNGRQYIAKSYFSVWWDGDALKIDTQTISIKPMRW